MAQSISLVQRESHSFLFCHSFHLLPKFLEMTLKSPSTSITMEQLIFLKRFQSWPHDNICVIWLQMKPFFSSTRPFWILTFFTSAPKIPPDDTEIPLDIDYEGVQPEQMEAAKCLFETVGAVLGRSARAALSVRAGFYELGGNSLNSIYTITRLRDRGYYIRKLLAVLLTFFSGILNLWRFYEVWLDFTEAWFHNFRYVK